MTAPADHYKLLRRLVALKRQKAEQKLRAAEQEAAKTRLGLELLDSSLNQLAAPNDGDEDGLRLLALKHGHDFHLIARRHAMRAQLDVESGACEMARAALRGAVFSEEELEKLD